MSPELQVFILAMMPISELRGSIPLGLVVLNLPLWKVFLISFLGNLIPVIFLLFFLEILARFLSNRSQFFEHFFQWLFQRTRKNFSPWRKKYGNLGLALFVAIPFPLTGAWTGSMIAFLFGFPWKVAFCLISFGVLIAGAIVSFLTFGGIAIERYFGWQTLGILAGMLLLIYLAFYLRKEFKDYGKK